MIKGSVAAERIAVAWVLARFFDIGNALISSRPRVFATRTCIARNSVGILLINTRYTIAIGSFFALRGLSHWATILTLHSPEIHPQYSVIKYLVSLSQFKRTELYRSCRLTGRKNHIVALDPH